MILYYPEVVFAALVAALFFALRARARGCLEPLYVVCKAKVKKRKCDYLPDTPLV